MIPCFFASWRALREISLHLGSYIVVSEIFAIALWVETGTEGFFSDLKIRKE